MSPEQRFVDQIINENFLDDIEWFHSNNSNLTLLESIGMLARRRGIVLRRDELVFALANRQEAWKLVGLTPDIDC